MKFASEKGAFIGIVILGTASLPAHIGLAGIFHVEGINFIIALLLSLPLSGVMLWLWFGTNYTISNEELLYASGPLKGKIDIKHIRKVSLNQTLYSGLKPALATKGIIISYNRYDEIYISPKAKEAFIQELLLINPEIEVHR